ncbi:Ycf48-like protein [compost metagenome]
MHHRARNMHAMTSFSRRGFCLLGLSGLAGAPMLSKAAQPLRDPMDRPSLSSRRAAQVLLTAVRRAGPRLVAVGERGVILTSDDHGASWVQRLSPVSVMLTNVCFRSADVGWAVGHAGVVLHTQDGGQTWSRKMDGVALAQVVLKAAQTLGKDAQVAAKLLARDGPDKPLLDVYQDDEIGLVVVGAFGLILRSGDDGMSWESWMPRVPNETGSHIYALMRQGKALYLAGEQGNVWRSLDVGRSFETMALPYKGSFFGATSLGEHDVVAYGLRGNALALRQGSSAWEMLRLPTTATVNTGMRTKDGSTLLATQAGELLRTKDEGRSFSVLDAGTTAPILGMTQAADGTIVLVGLRGATRVAASVIF